MFSWKKYMDCLIEFYSITHTYINIAVCHSILNYHFLISSRIFCFWRLCRVRLAKSLTWCLRERGWKVYENEYVSIKITQGLLDWFIIYREKETIRSIINWKGYNFCQISHFTKQNSFSLFDEKIFKRAIEENIL